MPTSSSLVIGVTTLVVLVVVAPTLGQECVNLDADVLILGAGMAGISAGKTLSNNGIDNFLILEGGDDIGGRVKSTEFGGVTVELGANWIQGVYNDGTPETHPLWPLKTKFNLTGHTSDYDDLALYTANGTRVSEEAVKSLVDRVYTGIDLATEEASRRDENGEDNIRICSALRFFGWNPVSSPEESFIEWYEIDYGFAESPDIVGLQNYPSYTYETYGPDDFFVSDQRGYATIIRGLANEYLTPNYKGDPRLHLNEVVKKIEWKECCVCATVENSTGSNHTHCAKTAIHTFSLGTLQAGTVEFVPQLPEEKRRAIDIFDMAYYLKIFVEFPTSFWDTSEFIGFAAHGRGYYPLIQPLDFNNGTLDPSKPPILLFTVTEGEALRVSSQPKNTTLSEIHQVLKTIYGDSVPAPIDILVPDWIQNPLFHGMYPNFPVDGTDEEFENLVEPVGTLVFSGDVSDANEAGFVHGAYTSGITGARQAMGFLTTCSRNGTTNDTKVVIPQWYVLVISLIFIFCSDEYGINKETLCSISHKLTL